MANNTTLNCSPEKVSKNVVAKTFQIRSSMVSSMGLKGTNKQLPLQRVNNGQLKIAVTDISMHKSPSPVSSQVLNSNLRFNRVKLHERSSQEFNTKLVYNKKETKTMNSPLLSGSVSISNHNRSANVIVKTPLSKPRTFSTQNKLNKGTEINNARPRSKNKNNVNEIVLCEDSVIEEKEKNNCTLKKSKSRRKPTRHATYVSELDKSLRDKYLIKKDNKTLKTKSVVEPVIKKRPFVSNIVKSSNASSQSSVTSDCDIEKAKSLVHLRTVHCPLHSKFVNKAYIHARCIEECPEFKRVASPYVNKSAQGVFVSSQKPLEVKRSILSYPMPIVNNFVKTCKSNEKRSISLSSSHRIISAGVKQNSLIPYSVIGSGRTSMLSSSSLSHRAVKSAKPIGFNLSHKLISEKKISEEKPIAIVMPRRKVRQKSFKLQSSRSRSKSFTLKAKIVSRKSLLKTNVSDESSLSDDADNDFVQDSLNDSSDFEAVKDLPEDNDDCEVELNDEKLADYYFELFRNEFPEIVKETHLTKEELVGILRCVVL